MKPLLNIDVKYTNTVKLWEVIIKIPGSQDYYYEHENTVKTYGNNILDGICQDLKSLQVSK